MLMAVCSAVLLAHEVVVEQIVEVTVAPRGDQLVVQMHVPAAVLADARLPHRADGTLDADAAALAIVAADPARNLDVRQNDAALAMPKASARIGADRTSIDVDLTYALRGERDNLSARLNTFAAAPLTTVRTRARFLPPSGSPQIIDVTGAPTRVTFDPPALAVARDFVTRALSSVLAAGDHLLLLACLLLASRRASGLSTLNKNQIAERGARLARRDDRAYREDVREEQRSQTGCPAREVVLDQRGQATSTAGRLIAAMVMTQTVSIALSGLTLSTTSAWPSIAATIAASAVVIAALQTIVGADARRIVALAVIFGLLNGATFGETLATSHSFAGGHPRTAIVTFVLAVVGGQLWIGGVMWATWRWLTSAGVPERIGAIVVSAFIAHTALHRVAERAQALADSGLVSADRALVWLTVAWAGVMVIVAAIDAQRRQRAGEARTPGMARSS